MRSIEERRAYARERANETRRVYVITYVGNVLGLVGNHALIKECGGIAETFRPERKPRTGSGRSFQAPPFTAEGTDHE